MAEETDAVLAGLEQQIRRELKGLGAVKEAVERKEDVDAAVRVRIVDVIRTLKVRLVSMLSRCSKARDDLESGIDTHSEAIYLKSEYSNAVASIESLTKLTRQKLRAEVSLPPDPAEAPWKTQAKDPIAVLLTEVEGLKRLVQRTNTHISDHEHPSYQKAANELTQDSDKLTIETAAFAEQHQQLKTVLRALEARVEQAEAGRNSDAPRKVPTYLISRSGVK